ncbi:MAG: hypothetical protein MI673_03075, partial [Thiotrichales bacterium]|nr:hypothetical protein [Thiotrichales bacterium]
MKSTLNKILKSWFDLTQRFSVIVISGFLLLAGASLYYTMNNLGMNTDTRDMLSPELQWRQLDLEYENLFPHSVDNLLIVIEAGTPDQASDAGADLYALLKQDTGRFKTVFSHRNLDFFRDAALLYLDETGLQDLADQLASNQAFLARLIADQNLRGLTNMLSEALEAIDDGEEIDLEPLLRQLSAALNANRNVEGYRLSWQKLLFDEKDRAVYRDFIVVQPRLDYSKMLPAGELMADIRQLAAESGLIEKHDVRIRFTGSVALSHEELQSVMQTNMTAVTGALILVSIVLIAGLGSGWLVFTILVTLITGLVLTAGFATLTVGELNLISVA